MKIADCEVTLIDSMGTDISVVNAARVSFHKESGYLYDDDDPTVMYLSEKDQKLLKFLADHGHIIPFAHAFLSFRLKIPIFIARQLGKHQVGLALSEVSRRYVDDEPEFFFPKVWRKRSNNIKQGSSNIPTDKQDFDMCPYDACQDSLHSYLNMLYYGVCPEQARIILPLNMMTEWVWSGSLLAFIRVCNLRLDAHTQKETQDVAKKIAHFVGLKFPHSWEVSRKYIENL